MRGPFTAGILVAVCLAAGCPSSPRFGDLRFGPRPFELDLPIRTIELRSGLVIALVPDDRTNLVSVDVRYKVGAAEDPAGRAGLAHLVEHLTFHLKPSPGDLSLRAELADAALVSNAYTNYDHTHFWSIGLPDRLDDLLELEARRMDPRCDQLDEAVFLRERDVVLEEHAERSSFASAADGWEQVVWGAGHPYGRPMASREVAEASREEACRFLDDHYAPNRAIVVITGRFDAESLEPRLIERFGAIARRSQGTRAAIAEPTLGGARTEHTTSSKLPFVVVSFAAPPWWHEEVVDDIAISYLAGALEQRGQRRFRVHGIARTGGAGAGLIGVVIAVRDEQHIDASIDAVYDAAEALAWRGELPNLEVRRAERRTRLLESVDGFWHLGNGIANELQYAPGEAPFASTLAAIDGYDSRSVTRWARRHLTRERSHVVVLRPAEDASPPPGVSPVASSEREHDLVPEAIPVDPDEAARPLAIPVSPTAPVHDYRLGNGLRVVLAPLPGSRVVDARLIFPVGGSAGRDAARLLRDDRSPDYVRYDRERLDWVFGLGTLLDVDVGERTTTFRARGLALFADWHVWRLFWRLHAGVYPERPKTRPLDPAGAEELRAMIDEWNRGHDAVVASSLFGAGAGFLDGWFDEAAATRSELQRFRGDHYVPRGATLIVAGGFEVGAMRGEVDDLFGSWRDEDPAAPAAGDAVTAPDGPRWIAIEDVDAIQVRITVAVGGLPRDGDRPAREVLVEILRAQVAHVREGQGATYGLHPRFARRGDLAAIRIDGHVDPRRAGRALETILGAVATLREHAAEQTADFARARRRALARALARSGAAGDLADELEAAVVADAELDARDRHASGIAELTPTELGRVAARDLTGRGTVVVVSGPGRSARDVLEGIGVAPGDITAP